MVYKLLTASQNSIFKAARLLAIFSAIGVIMGFLRDRAFVHFVGASEVFDIYIASFKVSDTLLFFSLGLTSAVAVNIMCERREKESPEDLKHFISNMFYALSFALIVGTGLLFFFMPYLVSFFFSGIESNLQTEIIFFSRILLIQAILFSYSFFFSAVLNFKRKFAIFGLLPVIYNLGIIFGVIFFFEKYAGLGLIYGVLLGAILGFLIQLWVLYHSDVIKLLPLSKGGLSAVFQTIKISLPFSAILSFNYFVNIALIGLIFSISQKVLSTYYFADALHAIPYSIVGVAYLVASYPVLIKLITDNKMSEFFNTINEVVRNVIFILTPLVVIIFVLSRDIVFLLFETGKFTSEDTFITSIILTGFIIHIIPFSLERIYIRFFQVIERVGTLFPIYVAVVLLKIAAVWFAVNYIIEESFIIQFIYNLFNFSDFSFALLFIVVVLILIFDLILAMILVILFSFLTKHNLFDLVKPVFQNFIAGIFLGITIWLADKVIFEVESYFATIIRFGVILVIGAVVWYLVLRLFKNTELSVYQDKLISKIYG